LDRRRWHLGRIRDSRVELSIRAPAVRLMGDIRKKEDAMKYLMLINQGTTPTPGSPEWDALSQEEQAAVYRDYQALNETPGVTPGERMEAPETATTVRVQGG